MQASRTWSPPGGTLGRILEETRRRLPSIEGASARQGAQAPGSGSGQRLRQALRRDHIAIIAEIKRRSPSKGTLNSSIDAAAQASAFERGGAAAISVLTEPTFFGGTLDDLRSAAAAARLPLLKKDFHVDVSQLVEARDAAATAVLLIVRALSPDDLPRMMTAARELGLETVVEVRSEEELGRAVEVGAEIIGVNSRNLETLEVDERVPERLMGRIPSTAIRIWESGIESARDVERAAACGADAVLVGSAVSQAADPAAFLASLRGVRRHG